MGTAAPLPDLVMGIGCNKWGTDPAKFDAGALEATYVAALDAGVTLFNTAQAYPTSEACLGGLRARTRRPAFVVSKFNSLAAAPHALVGPQQRQRLVHHPPRVERRAARDGVRGEREARGVPGRPDRLRRPGLVL